MSLNTVGQRLYALRNTRRIPQINVANKTGIAQPIVSMHERDMATLKGEHLKLYCDLYNCDPWWLLDGTGDAPEGLRCLSDNGLEQIVISLNSIVYITGKHNESIEICDKDILLIKQQQKLVDEQMFPDLKPKDYCIMVSHEGDKDYLICEVMEEKEPGVYKFCQKQHNLVLCTDMYFLGKIIEIRKKL